MKNIIRTSFLLLFGINLHTIAQVQVATFIPFEDVGIMESSPSTSFGYGPMRCGHTCSGFQSRVLMRFIVSSIPPGSTIISVNLTVHSTALASSGSNTATYSLHALTQGFIEYLFSGGSGSGADWQQAGSGYIYYPWNTPGGDYSTDTLSSQLIPHTLGPNNFPTSANFVSLVQSWVDSPSLPSMGIIMIADTLPCDTEKYFDSKEGSAPPVLEVTYVLPCSGPTAICQDINVYLDGTGNATIADDDINGGSLDDCGTGLTYSASQTSFSCADLSSGGSNGLIITGAYDGPLPGGVPKGVELYAGSAIADLSIYGIGSANNGGGTDGIEFTFPPVSVAAGTFLYVTTDSTGFNNYFGFDADFISGSMAINGDDAVELFQDSVVIDVFGDINLDGTGTAWDYLDGWAYRNDFSAANNGVWVESEFYYSGVDAMDFELTNATATIPFPIGSYMEASSGVAVLLTVTDGLGNTDMCSAIVTVLDSLAPIPNVPVLADITSDCPVDSILVVASENCQGQIAGTTNTAFPITASTTITWTYTDQFGNTSTQDQVVTINGLDVTTTLNVPTITANATGVTYQWIDCSNNAPIAGETSQELNTTADGDYAVIIDNGTCSDTSACQNITFWGLDELFDLGMTIAPNPSTGIFTVSFDDMVAGSVTIVDANGRLIQTQDLNSNSMTVDLTAAQSGLYFMHVATEKGISRERIVKY